MVLGHVSHTEEFTRRGRGATNGCFAGEQPSQVMFLLGTYQCVFQKPAPLACLRFFKNENIQVPPRLTESETQGQGSRRLPLEI